MMSTRRLARAAAASLLAISLVDAAAAQTTPAGDADATVLADEIVVTSTRGIADAEGKVAEVAGGGSVVDNKLLERGAISTSADFLNLQPGVYAQAAGGADGIKISIRGSAINRGANFFRSGILFLFDGLPVTGSGGTPYELFEPLGLSRTEILRGANASIYGSSTIGGAINYVTRTGAELQGAAGRAEFGSYGYRKFQLEAGNREGPLDYYVSATRGVRRGFQEQTAGRNIGVSANFGYELSENVRTRFFVRYRETFNETPGFLTKAQIAANPRQANALNGRDPLTGGIPTAAKQNTARIQPGSTWIANRTDFQLGGDSSFTLGLVYHDYPIDIQGGVNAGVWGYKDLSVVARYDRTDQLFGRDAKFTLGGLVTWHPEQGFQNTVVRIQSGANAAITTGPFARPALPIGSIIRRAYYDGRDGNIYLQHDSEPIARLHVILSVAAVNAFRKTGVSEPFFAGLTVPFRRNDWYAAPRAGFRLEATDKIQFFGNVSRSIEPHNDWSNLTIAPPGVPGLPATLSTGPNPLNLPAGSPNPAVGLAARGLPLRDQLATTYELGVRGDLPIVGRLSLSVYRADIVDELLSVEVVPATATAAVITAESNASPTLHQGIEFGLVTPIVGKTGDDGIGLTLVQSYTYSDFRFKRDRRFGRNRLPGIPEHTYNAQLNIDLPFGLYGSLSTSVASKNWLDYANTVSADRFQLFGASLGWQAPKSKFRVFVDLDNITNERYGAVVSPVFSLFGSDGPIAAIPGVTPARGANPRLTPGEGFTVIGGVSFAF